MHCLIVLEVKSLKWVSVAKIRVWRGLYSFLKALEENLFPFPASRSHQRALAPGSLPLSSKEEHRIFFDSLALSHPPLTTASDLAGKGVLLSETDD